MSLPPLYPHQVRSIAAIRAAYASGARRIVLVLPCGAGKTRTATAVVDGAIRKGRRVLVLAHREELIDQAAASLAKLGVGHGVITAGRASNPTAPIQVASQQTLASRPESMPPADILIPDECHHDRAETRAAIFARYPHAELVLGLTATPQRGDGQPLGESAGGIYQRLVVGATVEELQRTPRDMRDPDGPTILVPFRVVGPAAFQKELFRSPVAGYLEFGRAADGRLRPCLMFASSLPESRKIAAEANARGIRAAHVDGDTDTGAREAAFAALREGRLDLLSNVLIATEGTDLPNVEVVGVARGCSAASTWIQMVMRAGRSCPETGKRDALLIDFRGSSHVHGLMAEERTYSLDGRAITRADRVALRQCAVCGSVFAPAMRCPTCGLELPRLARAQAVKHVKAIEITAANIVPMATKRAYFDELVREMQAKGHKSTWVGMKWKSRFHFWPPWPIPGQRRAG